MIAEILQTYTSLGIRAIPIEWDTENKRPRYHVKGWNEGVTILPTMAHNGLMVQTHGEWLCFDFDLKNTDNKQLFDQWLEMLKHTVPDIFNKVYIETTRSGGYHVFCRYPYTGKKKALAEGPNGQEMIALYANGPLVYTWPTPGYQQFSNSMEDAELLTDFEFEQLNNFCQYFNEYQPEYDPNSKAVTYPPNRVKQILTFDKELSDDAWDKLLQSIGLQPMPNYRTRPREYFTAYHRVGSETDNLSAKVYFKTKRLMIFSSSMPAYPNWHNKEQYEIWSLPPSFVLYYKNNRSWEKAAAEMQTIAAADGLSLPAPDVALGEYPLHVFPDYIADGIREVCRARALNIDFAATAGLFTIASLSGNRYTGPFIGEVKNIIFAIMVAPVSVGKTPAYKVMAEHPLRKIMERYDQRFKVELAEWEKQRNMAYAEKKPFNVPRPRKYIPIAKDGTTEGYTAKCMNQPIGLGVYQDEAETIFNAGSYKATNDAVSYFTQAFSGGRYDQIRADETKERSIASLHISLLMGTQPERLKNIFTEDKIASGFASRFLIAVGDYILMDETADPFSAAQEMPERYTELLEYLFTEAAHYIPGKEVAIQITEDARDIYREYYSKTIAAGNKRILERQESLVIGVEAKMSAYLGRLAQILAILHNPEKPLISPQIAHYAWELYRYYANSTVKALTAHNNELTGGLPERYQNMLDALPEQFTPKQAEEACHRLNLPDGNWKAFTKRADFAKHVRKVKHGQFEKVPG